MECNRINCDGIMCDAHIDEFGYICRECQTEFKKYLQEMNEDENNMTLRGLKLRLNTFMNTGKGSFGEKEIISVDDFFNNNTR